MNYIKINMSRGEPITLSEEKIKSVLASPEQVVLITNNKGEWTGQAINKAHIVSMVKDYDKQEFDAITDPDHILPTGERPLTPQERQIIEDKKQKIREKMEWGNPQE